MKAICDFKQPLLKTAFFEGADCVVNKEKVRQTTKRCSGDIRNRTTSSNEVRRADKYYMRHLKMLLSSCDLETEQDEDDPTYLTFLENLREHRNSYILDVPSDHGVRFSLKYEDEDEDDPSDELKRKTLKSRSCISELDSLKEVTLIEKRSSLNLDRKLKSGVTDSNSKKTNTQRTRSREVVENLTTSPQKIPVSKLSEDHRSNLKAHLVDSSFKSFSSGAKDNEQSIFDKYGDGKGVYYKGRYQQKSDNVQNKPFKAVHTEKTQVSRSHFPIPIPIPSHPTRTVRAPAQSHAPVSRAFGTKDCQDGTDKPSKRDSRTQIPTSRPRTPAPRAPTSNPTSILRAEIAKDCHNVSDKPLKRASGTQIPLSISATRTPAPRAPASSSISVPRTSVIQYNHLRNFNFNSKSKITFSTTLEKERDDIRESRALFCKRLEISCREPYEKKEYDYLLEKVNVRKPIIVHKETRSRDYTKEGEMGKSYLDIYPDLHEEIKKVQSDPSKVLNLLRGFFLYLQYVPSGIMPPWKSSSLRTIMLGST